MAVRTPTESACLQKWYPSSARAPMPEAAAAPRPVPSPFFCWRALLQQPSPCSVLQVYIATDRQEGLQEGPAELSTPFQLDSRGNRSIPENIDSFLLFKHGPLPRTPDYYSYETQISGFPASSGALLPAGARGAFHHSKSRILHLSLAP